MSARAVRVLVFGSYRADLHPRVAVLAQGLRDHGLDVAELNEPLPYDTARRVQVLRQPWRLPVLVAVLARTWWRLWRRARALAGEKAPDVVLVGYLGHFDVHLARRCFPRSLLVLDQLVFAADTAADRGAGGRLLGAALRRLDAASVGAADLVVVDTEENRSLVAGPLRSRTVVVPVGSTADWLGDRPPARHVGLRVLFFGLFTPLQGAPTIAAAVRHLPADADVQLTLVGSGQDSGAVRALVDGDPRVRWHRWLSPDELRREAWRHDVCLGIFGTTPKAARVVPTKVYQGAAAGCALVTSDTAPQRRVLGGAARYVPAGDPRALAGALADLAADPDEVRRLQERARALARSDFLPAAATAPLAERIARHARSEELR